MYNTIFSWALLFFFLVCCCFCRCHFESYLNFCRKTIFKQTNQPNNTRENANCKLCLVSIYLFFFFFFSFICSEWWRTQHWLRAILELRRKCWDIRAIEMLRSLQGTCYCTALGQREKEDTQREKKTRQLNCGGCFGRASHLLRHQITHVNFTFVSLQWWETQWILPCVSIWICHRPKLKKEKKYNNNRTEWHGLEWNVLSSKSFFNERDNFSCLKWIRKTEEVN